MLSGDGLGASLRAGSPAQHAGHGDEQPFRTEGFAQDRDKIKGNNKATWRARWLLGWSQSCCREPRLAATVLVIRTRVLRVRV
jgi:hypothetical protein